VDASLLLVRLLGLKTTQIRRAKVEIMHLGTVKVVYLSQYFRSKSLQIMVVPFFFVFRCVATDKRRFYHLLDLRTFIIIPTITQHHTCYIFYVFLVVVVIPYMTQRSDKGIVFCK
jgi:hypothetical protein